MTLSLPITNPCQTFDEDVGGADTVSALIQRSNEPCLNFTQTVSTLYTFYLVMTLFPDIQTKAQEEIDRVVGNDRLPVLADRDSLPYLSALQSEIYRWAPVGPIGLSQ